MASILVVEDDKTISGMLEKILTEEGYRVTVATEGETAVKYLEDNSPDLVLLDLHVPYRSGFDLLGDIRKKDKELGNFVPVIILTGVYTSREDKVQSLNAGADDFLRKPFDLIELLARVRSLLRVQDLYKQSQFLATHDPLTKCHNRRLLMDFLDREYARFQRYNNPFTFMLLDMDHFKEVNDELGHDAGDQVLVFIGTELQRFFRSVDCVARLGGDEFAAVLPDCNANEAKRVGERLIRFMNDAKNKSNLPENLRKKVGISVGLASVPEHTTNKEDLLRLADQALYAAKKAGRNQYKMAA